MNHVNEAGAPKENLLKNGGIVMAEVPQKAKQWTSHPPGQAAQEVLAAMQAQSLKVSWSTCVCARVEFNEHFKSSAHIILI